MRITELREAVAGWFSLASGLALDKVLIGSGTPDPKGVRRPRPYAQVSVITPAMPVGQDERFAGAQTALGQAVERVIGHRRAAVSLQVMGEGAADFIERARLDCPRQRLRDAARERNISIVDIGPTIDLTRLLDTDYEERAQAELMVGYVWDEGTSESGTIEEVEVTATEITGTVGDIPLVVDTRNP